MTITVCSFGYEVHFLLSGVLPVLQNLNYKLQNRLSDVLSNQQNRQSIYSDALAHAAVPYQAFHNSYSFM